jgi:hypothetical protein
MQAQSHSAHLQPKFELAEQVINIRNNNIEIDSWESPERKGTGNTLETDNVQLPCIQIPQFLDATLWHFLVRDRYPRFSCTKKN